jgi:hypothetical protein
VGAGIQRILIDRDDIDPFRLNRRCGMGKRRNRFTPYPALQKLAHHASFGERYLGLIIFGRQPTGDWIFCTLSKIHPFLRNP